jgi:hypothetical protein
VRGVNYDTGTNYVPGWLSRPDWSEAVLQRDLLTIRDDLHCTAVTVFGSEPERLSRCADVASASGLDVWVQPRLLDASAEEYLDHLGRVAADAESLRAAGRRIWLNVGCELSVFSAGMLPGRGYAARARNLAWTWPLLPLVNRRLNRLLERAADVARQAFAGEITYGSGMWETVEWHRFDAIGLNHYRDRSTARAHEAALVKAVGSGRPVIVTEFGCCSFPGAEDLGPAADGILDWSDPERPQVVGEHPRDEGVQARYLEEMLDVFERLGVTGAFVFELVEPSHPRSDDPRYDVDVASFGIMAFERRPDASGVHDVIVPKESFHRVAARYAR